MNDSEFWKLIDASCSESAGEIEGQVAVLVRELCLMPVEEIMSYERLFVHYVDDAYDERLWAAGCILDELSDDGFLDFRAWLVSRGKDFYVKCQRDPDELAAINVSDGRVTAEEMSAVAGRAYRAATGRDDFVALFSPRSPHPRIKNADFAWRTPEGYADPSVLRSSFPNLWARFGQHPRNR